MRFDRWIQVISRYIGMVLSGGSLWVFERLGRDLPPEAELLIDNTSVAVAGLLVGLAGILADPIIHWFNNGGFMAAPESGGHISPLRSKELRIQKGAKQS